MKNVLFVSLGCDKNLVDSEKMLGLLNEAGYRVAQEESEADAIVVNTCCFIHDAKEESIQNILKMHIANSNISIGGMLLPVPLTAPASTFIIASRK